MKASYGKREMPQDTDTLVGGLAQSVIGKLVETPSEGQQRRLDVAERTLRLATLDFAPFRPEDIVEEISALRISELDLVEHCIPGVARRLGEDWLSDDLSFAEVSRASARLFGLCKEVGRDWDQLARPESSCTIMLLTMPGEQHLIGPTLLAQKLRRAGHSVSFVPSASIEDIQRRLGDATFDGVLMSVATEHGLDAANDTINTVRREFGVGVPIVLGGAALEFCGVDAEHVGAELVTNEEQLAIEVLNRTVVPFQQVGAAE